LKMSKRCRVVDVVALFLVAMLGPSDGGCTENARVDCEASAINTAIVVWKPTIVWRLLAARLLEEAQVKRTEETKTKQQ